MTIEVYGETVDRATVGIAILAGTSIAATLDSADTIPYPYTFYALIANL
jgi:hypothetical protein